MSIDIERLKVDESLWPDGAEFVAKTNVGTCIRWYRRVTGESCEFKHTPSMGWMKSDYPPAANPLIPRPAKTADPHLTPEEWDNYKCASVSTSQADETAPVTHADQRHGPDATAPEWNGWHIAVGSWAYWMIEQIGREIEGKEGHAGLKSLIRLLWAEIDKREAQKAEDSSGWARPKVEWDGEGYPPIGHQCEIWLSPEAGYVPFVPDYYGKRFVVGRANQGREIARRLCKAKFRPARTQRQIETEDLARDLLDDPDPLGVNLSGNTATAIAVSLMNRGWCKGANAESEQRGREEAITAALKILEADNVLTERDAAEALYDAGMLKGVE